jgi:hypothetical protein
MGLHTNKKKAESLSAKTQKHGSAQSKFISKGAASKPAGSVKKVRSTGANRGS